MAVLRCARCACVGASSGSMSADAVRARFSNPQARSCVHACKRADADVRAAACADILYTQQHRVSEETVEIGRPVSIRFAVNTRDLRKFLMPSVLKLFTLVSSVIGARAITASVILLSRASSSRSPSFEHDVFGVATALHHVRHSRDRHRNSFRSAVP